MRFLLILALKILKPVAFTVISMLLIGASCSSLSCAILVYSTGYLITVVYSLENVISNQISEEIIKKLKKVFGIFFEDFAKKLEF